MAKLKKQLMVPQELIQQIVDLYVNKLYGAASIKKVLKLGFTNFEIETLLREAGVKIRSRKDAKEIERIYGQFYIVNDYYDFKQSNGYWILGLFSVVGFLPSTPGAKNRVIFSVDCDKIDLLQAIAKEIEYKGELVYYEDEEGSGFAGLAFTSQDFRRNLEAYRLMSPDTEKERFTPKVKYIQPDYVGSFCRGFYDGCGSCFIDDNGQFVVSLNHTHQFTLQLVGKMFIQYFNLPQSFVRQKPNGIYTLQWSGEIAEAVMEKMYSDLNDDDLFSKVKRRKYLSIKTNIPRV